MAAPTTPIATERVITSRPQPQHHASHLRPALFVGPPSRNASAQSLERPPTGPADSSMRVPLLRQRTFRDDNDFSHARTTGIGDKEQIQSQAQRKPQRNQQPTTEAVWAEMQNTLEEVELAGMSGANVFGTEHARALDELRAAQIELARAWARSEGEGEEESLKGLADEAVVGSGFGQADVHGGVFSDETIPASSAGGGSVPGGANGKAKAFAAGLGGGKTQLEEETEHDIMLARRRRLANDKYFERVSKGVADVVARLAVVADKMGDVEAESQEIWGDKDSLESRNTK